MALWRRMSLWVNVLSPQHSRRPRSEWFGLEPPTHPLHAKRCARGVGCPENPDPLRPPGAFSPGKNMLPQF